MKLLIIIIIIVVVAIIISNINSNISESKNNYYDYDDYDSEYDFEEYVPTVKKTYSIYFSNPDTLKTLERYAQKEKAPSLSKYISSFLEYIYTNNTLLENIEAEAKQQNTTIPNQIIRIVEQHFKQTPQ